MYLTREGQGHITDLERLRSEQEGHFLLQSQGQPDLEYVLTQQSLGKTYTSGLNSPPVYTSSRSSQATQLVSSYRYTFITNNFQVDEIKQKNSFEGQVQKQFIQDQCHATSRLHDQFQGL